MRWAVGNLKLVAVRHLSPACGIEHGKSEAYQASAVGDPQPNRLRGSAKPRRVILGHRLGLHGRERLGSERHYGATEPPPGEAGSMDSGFTL